MDSLLQNISTQVGTYLPGILTAAGVLIIGWILAHLIARGIKMAMNKSGLGAKMGQLVSADGAFDASTIISKVVFYLLMAFVLVTFFNVLNLPVVSEPLNSFLSQIFEFAPRVLSAGILGVIAYVLARLGREVLKKTLDAADIDTRLASLGKDAQAVASTVQDVANDGLDVEDEDGIFDIGDSSEEVFTSQSTEEIPSADSDTKLSETLPDAAYWGILALFLPAILGALQMPGLLEPVQSMFTKALNYLPNIFGAGIILLIGNFIAKIIRQVISNLAASLGVNSLASRFGLGDSLSQRKLSDVLGVIVYALILMPVIVAALNTLDIDAVTQPASAVLGKVTSLIPGFIGAAIVLGIAWFVGQVVSGLVEDLLAGIGFDQMPQKIGLNLSSSSESSPSRLGGKVVLIAIVLLSAMQALPMMGLESFAGHVETFVGFATQVLVGLAIFAIGMYLASGAAKLVRDSGIENATQLATVARIAIIIFAGGFALQQMGLSASIVNVAFGSLLGGIGLAAAIAFGWGGRDAAKRIVDRTVR